MNLGRAAAFSHREDLERVIVQWWGLGGIRISQEGALEPDTLYTGEKKPVPSARVEVFALDEYVDKERNPSPVPTAEAGDLYESPGS